MYKILLRLVGIWPCYDKMHQLVFWNTVNFVGVSVIHVSQGSVATYVRCGGMSTWRRIANFHLSLIVKEFLKSVKIWQSYCQKFGGFLFWNTVYIDVKSSVIHPQASPKSLVILIRYRPLVRWAFVHGEPTIQHCRLPRPTVLNGRNFLWECSTENDF